MTRRNAQGGKRGKITYQRVVPRFLQKAIPNHDRNLMAAKRGNATHHLGKHAEDKRSGKIENDGDFDIAGEIAELEKEGFAVVTTPQDAVRKKRTPEIRAGSNSGRIEKRAKTRKPLPDTFRVNNKQRLSFGADSDSEEDDG